MMLLASRTLVTRWSRTLTAVIGIGLAIALAYVMSGVVAGFQAETSRTLRAIGNSFLVPESSSGLLNNLTDASEPPDGTQAVLFARDSLERQDLDLNIFGTRPGLVDAERGRPIEGPGEVVIDVSAEVAIGDTVTLAGRDLEVVGHTEGTRMFGGGPVVYMELAEMQELYFNGRPVAQFFASSEAVDPPEGLAAMSFARAKDDIDRAVRGAISSLALTRTLLWVMVGGVVLVLNRLTLLDRWAELATLKCLGAGSLAVGSSLVVESVAVGALGAGLGCLGGLALAPLFPLAVELDRETVWQIVLLSVAVSFAVAVLGTWRLRAVAPSDAFRGEL